MSMELSLPVEAEDISEVPHGLDVGQDFDLVPS